MPLFHSSLPEMVRRSTAEEIALNSWASLGLAGTVLAVFVVPVFAWLLNGVKARELAQLERDKLIEAERQKREAIKEERERIMVQALVDSVNAQRESLKKWDDFEREEVVTHRKIVDALEKLAAKLA